MDITLAQVPWPYTSARASYQSLHFRPDSSKFMLWWKSQFALPCKTLNSSPSYLGQNLKFSPQLSEGWTTCFLTTSSPPLPPHPLHSSHGPSPYQVPGSPLGTGNIPGTLTHCSFVNTVKTECCLRPFAFAVPSARNNPCLRSTRTPTSHRSLSPSQIPQLEWHP